MDNIGQDVYSWTVVSRGTVLKKLDRSAILYKMTGIPVEIRWFFDLNQLRPGDKQVIVLQCDGSSYEAYLSMGVQSSPRTRLTWGAAFAQVVDKRLGIKSESDALQQINKESGNLGAILFEKKSDAVYMVSLERD